MDEAAFLPLFCDPSGMRALLDAGVIEEMFFDEVAKDIFQEAAAYYVGSRFTKALTRELIVDGRPDREEWISRRGWPEEEYWAPDLARRLIEKWTRVRAQDVLLDVGERVQEDPAGGASWGAQELSRVVRASSPRSRAVEYGRDFSERYDAYLDSVLEPKDPGIPLGWPQVTYETHGIKPGELAIVAGRLKQGKSWALAKIALSAAKMGFRTWLGSYEMPLEAMRRRIDCLISGVSFREYERGELRREQLEALKEAAGVAKEMGDLLMIDAPTRRSDKRPFEVYARAVDHGAQLVVGDQLSRMVPPVDGRASQEERMASLVDEIKDLTLEHGVASVWASQLNREAARSLRPGAEALSRSDVVGQTPDWVFMILADDDMRRERRRLFGVRAARRGREVAWLLRWELDGRTLVEVDREYGGDW